MKKIALLVLFAVMFAGFVPTSVVSAQNQESALDSEARYNWQGPEAVVSIGSIDRATSLRVNSSDVEDIAVSSLPFWQNRSVEEVKNFSLTDYWGRTYQFSSHNFDVCRLGPNFTFLKKGDEFLVTMENTTKQDVQIVLRLGDQSGPAGRMTAVGGGFEVKTTDLYGAVEVLVGDENGPTCATLQWDYRDVPAPRVVAVTEKNRIITLVGDNFFPYLGEKFDPESMIVWFIDDDSRLSIAYPFKQIREMGGSWEPRQITIKLPENFPAGTFMVKVTLNGKSSPNGVFITVPEIVKYKYFLPLVVK